MGKHKAKRGRPPKPYENPMQVALDARMKHTGISEKQATSVYAGSLLGRLLLAGTISSSQHKAGELFEKAEREYHAALLGPKGYVKTNPGSGADEPPPEYIEWAIAAALHRKRAREWLTDDQWRAIDAVLNESTGCLLDDLLAGLTALAKGYRLIGQKEAA